MPEQITVYRGCARARVEAISWTTDKKIAEGFAHGHRFIRPHDPVIAVATIEKADILAVFVGESEVIARPDDYSMYPYSG